MLHKMGLVSSYVYHAMWDGSNNYSDYPKMYAVNLHYGAF